MTISTTKIVVENSPRSTLSTERSYVAVRVRGIPAAVRWSFLLFVFAFPFEATALGVHSIAKVVGLLFFAIYFFHYNPLNRSIPPVSGVMWWFLVYVGIYIVSVFRVAPELFGQFLLRGFTLVQLLGFFWVASDLLKDEYVAKRVLLTYSLAAALFAAGILLRVPGFSQEIVAGRVTGAGENLNLVATHMAVALVIAIGLIVSTVYNRFALRILVASLTLPVLLAMIGTGSRGGIAAFLVGMFVYVLPYWKKKRTLAVAGCVAVGIIGVVYLVANSPDLLARWQESYYEGKLSDREKIFADSIQMISERPVFGWGPVEYGYELGFRGRSSDPNDTHNLVFHLLAEVGIVGTIPFLIGLCLVLRQGWLARPGSLGLLPLALMATILTANLSGNNLVWKPQWLVMALATASALTLPGKFWIRSAPRLPAYRRTAGDRSGFLSPGKFT